MELKVIKRLLDNPELFYRVLQRDAFQLADSWGLDKISDQKLMDIVIDRIYNVLNFIQSDFKTSDLNKIQCEKLSEAFDLMAQQINGFLLINYQDHSIDQKLEYISSIGYPYILENYKSFLSGDYQAIDYLVSMYQVFGCIIYLYFVWKLLSAIKKVDQTLLDKYKIEDFFDLYFQDFDDIIEQLEVYSDIHLAELDFLRTHARIKLSN